MKPTVAQADGDAGSGAPTTIDLMERLQKALRETAKTEAAMRASNSVRIHFSTTNLNAGPAACGENRDPRRRLTLDPLDVTCDRCRRTVAWDRASSVILGLPGEGRAIRVRREVPSE